MYFQVVNRLKQCGLVFLSLALCIGVCASNSLAQEELQTSEIIVPGMVKWEFPISGLGSAPAIGPDGTIYVSTSSNNFYAIHPDGTEKWILETAGEIESPPVVGLDGTIYVWVEDSLYAINPDGTEKWIINPTADSNLPPAIGPDGTLYLGFEDGLYAIEPENGEEKWRFNTFPPIPYTPAIGSDGTIYAWAYKDFYAINPDGTEKWVFTAGSKFSESPIIDSDGTIYVGCDDGFLYALNPNAPTPAERLKWVFDLSGLGGWVNVPPVIASDGTIYVASSWYDLFYAVNADGTMKWVLDLQLEESPAIGADNALYFDSGRALSVIDPDGTLKWSLDLPHPFAAPAIASDGTIYLSMQGSVMAVYTDSGGLANSPWPMLRQNVRHTGLQPLYYLSIDMPKSASEAAGTVTGTVDIQAPLAADLEVFLSSDSPDISIPSSVTILSGSTSASFDISVQDDGILDGSKDALVFASSGYEEVYDTIAIHDDETATLSLSFSLPLNVTEDYGLYGIVLQNAGVITCSAPVEDEVRIFLTSDDTSEIVIPGIVVMPEGSDTAIFDVTVVDDMEHDGTQIAGITAVVAGWTPGYDSIDVEDNEDQEIQVEVWDYWGFTEGDGFISRAGTISIPGILTYDLTINLSSEDTSEIEIPTASVTIPAGDSSVSFDIIVVDDNEYDGTQTATISAAAPGWTTGFGSIEVMDNEIMALEIFILEEVVSEGDGIMSEGCEVAISGPLAYDLTVNLFSDDTTEITVPEVVTIYAGETTALFEIMVEDDVEWDGLQTVTVSGDAPGVSGGERAISVRDNEVYYIDINPIPNPQYVGNPFYVTVTAYDINTDIAGLPGPVLLGASDTNGPISLTPNETDVFWDGQWTGRVTINDVATNVVLSAGDGPGLVSTSNFFDVIEVLPGPGGERKWSFEVYDEGSPAIGADGTIYAAGSDIEGNSGLYAINPNGTEKWRFTINDGIEYSSPAIGVDGTIYVSAFHGNLYAVHPNGTEKWTVSISDRHDHTVSIGPDGTLYVGSENSNLHAINPDGSFKWSFPIVGNSISTPTIGADGTIYAGSDEGLYALNPDKSQKWLFAPGDRVDSPAIDADGTLYAASGDDNLYAIHPDGSPKWVFTIGEWISSSPVIGIDGTIYVNAHYGTLYAINPDNTEKWRVDAYGDSDAAPAIGADGTIYVNSRDISWGNLHAFNPDGSQKWTVYTHGGSSFPSPAIGHDGTVYFGGARNGDFLAISTDCGGVADSPWPLFQHDVRRTGRQAQHHLSLSLPESATEGDGTLTSQGWIEISEAIGTDLIVSLSSSDTTELIPPPTVTILAGDTSAFFDLAVEDDVIADGPQLVAVTGFSDYGTAYNTMTIHDNETAILTLSLPASATEGDGVLSGQGTVFCSTAAPENVSVFLSSDDTTEVRVPSSVMIPAGSSSADFDLTVVNDVEIDGPQTATITASVSGWTAGSAAMNVTDNEITGGEIVVAIPPRVAEGDGLMANGGMVSINGAISSDLIVNLQSNDTGEIVVPATVTIPARQASVFFDIEVQDDTDQDGTQTVTITAQAGGFTSGSDSTAVRDNEVSYLGISQIASPQQSEIYFAVTLTAYDINSEKSAFSGPASLSAVGAGGWVDMGPGSVDFDDGLWIGAMGINEISDDVIITVDDGAGHSIMSNRFDVIASFTGMGKWAFPLGPVYSSPAIGADGTIYVGSSDGNLYAINPDRSQKWAFSTSTEVFASPAIGADGTIYVGSYSTDPEAINALYAINPDGSEQWRFTTSGAIISCPAIAEDGTIYIGSIDSNLYAINPDGTPRWSFATGGEIWSSPAIAEDGTVYVGSYDSNLYAINPDGTQQWAFATDYAVASSPAIGGDGTIYVGSHDSNLYAIDPDGSLVWAFSTGNTVFSSPAIGEDGTIYVGSYDSYLYAINPVTVTLKWAYRTDNDIWSSPAIGADGTIYVGSMDDNLHAIHSDGTPKWVFSTNGDVISSPVIDEDSTIYVGSGDGSLYAIKGDSGGLALTPWPMFHQNVRHTGRWTLWDDANLIEWNGNLVADFGDRGMWYHDGSAWNWMTNKGHVNQLLVWDNNLVVDFGRGRGMRYYDGSWHWMTNKDDVHKMMVWDDGTSEKLVVDFGGGRGMRYYDGSWHWLNNKDGVSAMIVWDQKLVVDFGRGRGMRYYDGSWHWLNNKDDVSAMIVWDQKLVVDFGGGRGMRYYDGSWRWMTNKDDVHKMMVWDDGTSEKLVVDFGAGRRVRYYDGSWHWLNNKDNVSAMIVWDQKLVVDFGGGRGVRYYDGSWHWMTNKDDVHKMMVWDDGTSEKLVVDFGGGRGMRYYDGSWHWIRNKDDVPEMIVWGNRLAVDFGSGTGIYNYDGSWQWMKNWSTRD
ncbi:MAG: PQQ-binding-like beta-propeller repeat protein [Myxococcota bacterium]|nr:PQQ-binding-like beta-propeller repeat protein [Myxococcota bacterium]